MDHTHSYNGSLTAEQFLFYEIRIASKFYIEGKTIEEAIEIIKKDNLFQYPTERQVSRLAKACYKRLDALDNEQLVREIAFAPNEMVFGTDRFFNHLKNGIISDGSEAFYAEVLKVIERDAYPRVMSRLNYPDAEDVMQQVLLSVWTSLAKYVMTSENLIPQQPNAWLIRIIDNKIADYFRKRYATIEISCDDTERVFDELIENDPQEAFVLDEDHRLRQRQVDNLMYFICSINMIPEKIIAFFYSKVIYFIQSNGDLKGSAKYAYKMLNGRTFAEIQSSFQFDLEAALGREIPPYALEGLYEKLNACDLDTILKIELSTINDSTNYIIKRIRNVDKSSILEVK